MTLRKSQGVGTLTMRLCMGIHVNGHPCSFLDTHLKRVSKPCDGNPCYEEACVFLLIPWSQGNGIDDTIQRVTFVYFLCQCLSSAVFHKVQITEYYNNPLIIVHFYNLKRITLIANIKLL